MSTKPALLIIFLLAYVLLRTHRITLIQLTGKRTLKSGSISRRRLLPPTGLVGESIQLDLMRYSTLRRDTKKMYIPGTVKLI